MSDQQVQDAPISEGPNLPIAFWGAWKDNATPEAQRLMARSYEITVTQSDGHWHSDGPLTMISLIGRTDMPVTRGLPALDGILDAHMATLGDAAPARARLTVSVSAPSEPTLVAL